MDAGFLDCCAHHLRKVGTAAYTLSSLLASVGSIFNMLFYKVTSALIGASTEIIGPDFFITEIDFDACTKPIDIAIAHCVYVALIAKAVFRRKIFLFCRTNYFEVRGFKRP